MGMSTCGTAKVTSDHFLPHCLLHAARPDQSLEGKPVQPLYGLGAYTLSPEFKKQAPFYLSFNCCNVRGHGLWYTVLGSTSSRNWNPILHTYIHVKHLSQMLCHNQTFCKVFQWTWLCSEQNMPVRRKKRRKWSWLKSDFIFAWISL